MKVGVLCERSGVVRDAFIRRGHDAVSCDILPGGRQARRSNQTPSGQNKLGPSPDRAFLRAKTYQGIADAMADQWGTL